MSGEKIFHVIKTIKLIISQLKKEDRIGVVTYSDSVDVTFPVTAMDSEGKKIACEQLDKIKTEGCKDLCSGLKKAVEMIKRLQVKNEVSSILLFTDGNPNRGVTRM
jgi:Mg-chelatase subunit ChlD